MRFVIDENVDADCGRVLRDKDHDAWLVSEAGRSSGNDTDQLIYTQRRDAVFVTHDNELYNSRSKMPIGRLIRLRCPEWEAPELLDDSIDDVALILERHQDLFVTLSRAADGTVNMSLRFGSEH